MATYDAVIVGAGLGGLTSGAILARAGRKVLVIERGNSVGGAASSYKVGDLFVEGSLHETSNPHDPRDPKHDALKRAGVLDAVKWVPSEAFYEVRGGPLQAPLLLPDNFEAARHALTERFPAARAGIAQILGEMEHIAGAAGALARGEAAFCQPSEGFGAPAGPEPVSRDWTLSLAEKLDRVFGDNEAIKCALAANLSYYHDDPGKLWWVFFALAQGGYLLSGGRYIQNGSQRLSSALAREIRKAGSEVLLRRLVTHIGVDDEGRAANITHTARDGSDPQTVEAASVISNAAPSSIAAMLPQASAEPFAARYAGQPPSISLFALTLGLARPPREFGLHSYSTQLLPDWMTSLADYAQASAPMEDEPAGRMPPLAIANYDAIASGVPAPPYVLSITAPDSLANWAGLDTDGYRTKRARWQDAIIAHLDRHYPGLAGAVVAASFNTSVSMLHYLAAPQGAVYGFAPLPPGSGLQAPPRSPATAVPGLYLASAYAGFGGYTGVIAAAAACADAILGEAP